MAAMESLRVALAGFPALVASAAPSRIDRQLREVAAALAALLSPQEADVMLLEQQAAQDDAVHLLLDTFCRAHAEDHMSDHTKLGSWRLPYVAMLHSHTSLHFPLINQLELLLHSSAGGASLTPVQCSALSTFMLFMNPYQVSTPKTVLKDPTEADAMHIDSENAEESRPKPIGNSHVRALFGWRWEACCGAQSTGHRHGRGTMEPDEKSAERCAGSAETGKNGWMERFCGSFLLDSETDILWATRFAASYLRNVAVYWEHVLFFDTETWMVADLIQQSLKKVLLVGPLFVAFVPQNLVLFLLWLRHRLNFAFHSSETTPATLKKASLLCESLLSCPLGLLLQSTKPSQVPLCEFFELELRTGSWNQAGIFVRSCHQFLRHVVWGGAVDSPERNLTSGLLWKEYGGDRARACVALTKTFLTNQCGHDEEAQDGGLANTRRSGECSDEGCESLPLLVWLKAGEANIVEVLVVQVIVELASGLDVQYCGPWLLEAAFECLESQVRLENAILLHRETCWYAQKCKSRHNRNPGICSAHRLKSCIAALPPSHSVSFERSNKMEKVFVFCWQGDGPFSIDFAVQLLSSFQISQNSGILLQAEHQWSTLLLAAWVRFFNVIGAPILNLQHVVGDMDLGSILTHLHTVQQFLTSNTLTLPGLRMFNCSRNFSPGDISGFKAAATAMPQLAAITLIESLFTSSTTNLSLKEGFLSNLATTEASPHQHELSNRFLDILRKTMEPPPAHHETLPKEEDGTGLFLFPNLLLFHLVDLLSMAAIACPDLILQKWSQLEYKRKWLMASAISSTKLLSMASINLEFDERFGKPQERMFDVLLEWVVALITLCPGSISHLTLSPEIPNPGTLNPKPNGGGIEVGPKALVLVSVVAGLGRDTVLGLDSVVKNNWKILLSEVRGGLENGFRRLFFAGRDVVDVGCEVSGVKADMKLFVLKLQGVVGMDSLE